MDKKRIQSRNIFETCDKKRIVPIVSFEDCHAIKIDPLYQRGVCLLAAKINLKNKPITRTNRDFVMALLSYLPVMDCILEQ